MIASARLYEWAPSLTTAWRRLLEWVSARADVGLTFLDSRSVSLDELWSREDLGCVFMCGYPWALAARRPALLAVPVPAPPRYGGRPVYVSDFIVAAEGPHRTLEDTFGHRIGYSAEHSQSGYNAPRRHLAALRPPGRVALYREVRGPYVRQRAVIQAVLDGEVDVAAIDGYAHDLLRRHDPTLAGRLRVVASTEPAPAPPLVASPALPEAERARLAAALIEAHHVPEIQPVLDDLLLARFDRPDGAAYETLLEWQRGAQAAGYPSLA